MSDRRRFQKLRHALVIDVVDVIRCLLGDRTPTVVAEE